MKEKAENVKQIKEKIKTLKIEDLIEEKNKNHRRKRVRKHLNKFQKVFDNYRKEYITKELNNIAEKIRNYYNNFIIDQKIDKLRLKTNGDNYFEAQNEKYNSFDPLLILSEGQLRCFGLAILFAINNKIGANYIILDDIVNAIDIEHRRNIIDVISNELSADKQFIITTHDKLFKEKLINTINQPSKIKSYYLNRNTNLTLNENTNDTHFIKKIKKLIKIKDCRNSLIYMRIVVENSVFDIAENCNIELPFKNRQYKYNLSTVFDKLNDKIKLFDALHKYLRKPLIWMMLNQENHYWSEKAVCLDCQLLYEIFEAVLNLHVLNKNLSNKDKIYEVEKYIKENKYKELENIFRDEELKRLIDFNKWIILDS